MMKENRCPICESVEFKPVFSCNDYLVSKKDFEIIECEKCAMRITKDCPSESEIGAYYESEEYISHSDVQKGLFNRAYHTVRQFMLGQKARWVIKNSGLLRGNLLDVGSGTGYFPKKMKDKGWNVKSIEINDLAREFSQKNFGLDVCPTLQKYVETKENENQKLDVITLWHVLEHIENVDETMKTFHQLLSVGGTLIVAVPNCSSYDAKKYENDWVAYDVPRHLWHFRPKQIELLAEKYGFELVAISPMFFDSFYISMMSEKHKNSKNSLLKGAFYGGVGAVKTLFNKKESSSLVYFLRKKVTH